MMKEKIKQLIESVIDDLNNGVVLSTTLLKCQTIAFHLKNEIFSEWINNELNGYDDLSKLPNYRKLPCTISVNIVSYNCMLNNKQIPQGAIPSEYAYLYEFTFVKPLSEIEILLTGDITKSVTQPINAHYTYIFQEIIQGGRVQEVHRHVPIFSLIGIINNFKSKLLNIFLELNRDLDFNLDFISISNQKLINNIMNQNIFASGNGDVNANNSTLVGGSNNNVSINENVKSQIRDLIQKVEEVNERVKGDETDIAECIAEIQQEISLESPQPKVLKTSLKWLRRIPKIAAESAIGVAIEKVIEQLI